MHLTPFHRGDRKIVRDALLPRIGRIGRKSAAFQITRYQDRVKLNHDRINSFDSFKDYFERALASFNPLFIIAEIWTEIRKLGKKFIYIESLVRGEKKKRIIIRKEKVEEVITHRFLWFIVFITLMSDKYW